ncbi:hypothetical protein K505DRAFT_222917, partial [Melanomma pulvis-pyrius CBS 109.77]
IRNGATGTKTKRTHHCGECGKAPTAECFRKNHVDYCTAPMDNQFGVCGMKFNVLSPGGCANHIYRNGFNLRIRNERRGLDPDHKTAWELEQEAKIKAEEDAAGIAAEAAAERAANQQYFRQKAAPREKTKMTQGKKQ